ncbi:hypothetical protein Tco_0072189 [Tanacetum coccineum]
MAIHVRVVGLGIVIGLACYGRSNEAERDMLWGYRFGRESFGRDIQCFETYKGKFGKMAILNMTITRSGMTPEAIEELVNRRVEEALAAYEATRAVNALEAENQSQNGSDGDNGNGGDGRNENPNENNRDARPVSREYTYQDFMKCQLVRAVYTHV